jgi:hypothetical protein
MEKTKIGRNVAKGAYVVTLTALSYFSPTASIMAVCTTILVLLYDKAGSLIELSFGPLKAKLERDVSEADKLVAKLREFAVLQARMLVSASVKTGRWPVTSDWTYVSAKSTEAALKDLGVPAAGAKTILDDLIRYTVFDLSSAILGNQVPLQLDLEGSATYHALRDRGLDITPSEVEDFLIKWNMMTPACEQRLGDMRWIIEHGDIRDREQFLRSQEPA